MMERESQLHPCLRIYFLLFFLCPCSTLCGNLQLLPVFWVIPSRSAGSVRDNNYVALPTETGLPISCLYLWFVHMLLTDESPIWWMKTCFDRLAKAYQSDVLFLSMQLNPICMMYSTAMIVLCGAFDVETRLQVGLVCCLKPVTERFTLEIRRIWPIKKTEKWGEQAPLTPSILFPLYTQMTIVGNAWQVSFLFFLVSFVLLLVWLRWSWRSGRDDDWQCRTMTFRDLFFFQVDIREITILGGCIASRCSVSGI